MLKNQLWKPWIGKNFNKQETKILLIGESHYSQDSNGNFDKECYEEFINDSETTQKIIQRLINGESWRIFDNTYKFLFNNRKINVTDFWEQFSFYNLIQRPMKTMKEKPSKTDFKQGIETSLEVINEMYTKPDYVIFLGNSGRHYLKNSINNNENYRLINEKTEKIGRYFGVKFTIENTKEIQLIFIKHPSSYFSWNKWNEFIIKDNFKLKKYLEKNIS